MSEVEDFADALIVAHRRAPRLDPHMKAAAAQTAPTLEDAATNAGNVAAFGGALKMSKTLSTQDNAIQIRLWDGMNQATKDMVLAAGYRPPMIDEDARKHASRGWFGKIAHYGGNVVGFGAKVAGGTLENVEGAGQAVLSETLEKAGAPLRAVQHGYRAARLVQLQYMQEKGLEGDAEWMDTGWLLTGWGDWSEAWDASKDGESTFDPIQEEKARSRWGDEVVDLAKVRASVGDDPILAAIGEEDPAIAAEFARRFTEDVELKDATDFMEASHISWGRTLISPDVAVDNPTLHKFVSGGADALMGWYADPLVVGGKVAKSRKVAKLLVRDADDVNRIRTAGTRTSRAAHREIDSVIAALKEGPEKLNAGTLTALKSRWAPVAEDLVREKVDTSDKLWKWMADTAGMDAMLRGRLSGLHTQQRTLPTLSRFGEMSQNFKNGVAGVIDFADTKNWIAGDIAKKFTTLIPRGVTINARSKQAHVEIGRLARLVLPERRARDIESVWSATRSIGQRRKIYHSLLEEMREAAGLPADDKWWQSIVGAVDDDAMGAINAGQQYSSIGRDVVRTEAGTTHDAIRSTQLSTNWRIPDARTFFREVAKYKKLGLNSEYMDKAMNVWRTSVVLRPAFALRAGGEEALLAMMRYSPKAIAKARLAKSSEKGAAKILPYHPLHRMWEGITKSLPPEIADVIDTPRRLAAAHVGDNARRALRSMEGRLAGEEYLNGAEAMMQHDSAYNGFVSISAKHEGRNLYLQPMDAAEVVRDGGIITAAQLKATGKYTTHGRGGSVPLGGTTVYTWAWHGNLSEIAHDPPSLRALREVIESGGQIERDVLIQRVKNSIRAMPDRDAHFRNRTTSGRHRNDVGGVGRPVRDAAPKGPAEALYDLRKKARDAGMREDDVVMLQDWLAGKGDDILLEDVQRRVSQLADRLLGEGWEDDIADVQRVFDRSPVGRYATQDEALEDWAADVVDDTLHILSAEDGVLNEELARRLIDGDVPSIQELHEMDDRLKPFEVKGPELIPVYEGENRIRALVDKSFHEMVGRPLDWIVREPLYLHNYVIARKQAELMADSFKMFKNAEAREKYVNDVATERAVKETITYVDDPRLRSQFSVVTRNLMPFYFAQEQFYKRVAKTFAHNPAAFRQGQLVASGLRNMGVLHKDQRGNDYFFMPVVGQLVQEYTAQSIKMFTGRDGVLPIPVGWTGEVRMLAPGITDLIVPSFSPWVGVAAAQLGMRFPEMEPLQKGIEGEHAGRPTWEMFVPSSVARFFHAFNDDPDKSGQMWSATIQAMQYLEANGLGPESESAADYEIWIERVKNWTRSIMVTRAVLGLVAPASPTLHMGEIPEMHEEFVTLIGQMGYEEALETFMRRHPDASPYTIFQTKSASGRPLPATKTVLRYMKKNEELFKDLPRAAGWLIPMEAKGAEKEEYSPEAYREQLAWHMRTRQPTLKDVWKQIKFAEAKDLYFTAKEDKNKAIAEAGDDYDRKFEINETWRIWKDEYFATHRMFAEELNDPESAQRRQDTLKEIRLAMTDPRYPKDKQAQNLRTMVDAYDDYQMHVDAIRFSPHPGTNKNKALLASYKTIFTDWAADFIEKNPDADLFYRMVIEQIIDPDANVEL